MSETFCPWEQLADETGSEWTAFIAYRDQGPTRSLMEASRIASVSKNSCTKWSRAYSWEARVRAWDAEVDRVRRQRFLAEQRRIIRVHADVAQELRKKAMNAVELITAGMLALDPDKALRWIKFATELEAKACGLPTEVTALSLTGGQPNNTADVYFDSLPKEKLLDIVRMSMSALQKDGGVPNSERDGQAELSAGEEENRGTIGLESGTRLRLGDSQGPSHGD